MKRYIHFALLAAPLLIWSVWLILTVHGRHVTDRQMADPNGLTWHTDGRRLTASVRVSEKEERQVFLLRITDDSGTRDYQRELVIDWDMGTGGFLKAMQADTDPEPEILFSTGDLKDSFIIDVSSGRIEEKQFSTASPESQKLAGDWMKYHVLNPFAFGFYAILTVFFYIFYIVFYWGARKIIRPFIESRKHPAGS